MINPYKNVNWENVKYLVSSTHEHIHDYLPESLEPDKDSNTPVLQSKYDYGLRHFAISEHSPSINRYPLSDHMHDVPADIVESPNTEIRYFGDFSLHFLTIGCEYRSTDNPDFQFYDENGDLRAGPLLSERHHGEIIDYVLTKLRYEDGGGLVVAHPQRYPTFREIVRFLDYHPLVIGIEVWNLRSGTNYDRFESDSFDMWDNILKTGRECIGTFGTDIGTWTEETKGRAVLLVDEEDDYNAMKAYRKGNFFGAMKGGLHFTNIQAGENSIFIETDGADKITFIYYKLNKLSGIDVQEQRFETTFDSDSAQLNVDKDFIYARVVAEKGDESIYSQAFMYKNKKEVDEHNEKKEEEKNAIFSVLL